MNEEGDNVKMFHNRIAPLPRIQDRLLYEVEQTRRQTEETMKRATGDVPQTWREIDSNSVLFAQQAYTKLSIIKQQERNYTRYLSAIQERIQLVDALQEIVNQIASFGIEAANMEYNATSLYFTERGASFLNNLETVLNKKDSQGHYICGGALYEVRPVQDLSRQSNVIYNNGIATVNANYYQGDSYPFSIQIGSQVLSAYTNADALGVQYAIAAANVFKTIGTTVAAIDHGTIEIAQNLAAQASVEIEGMLVEVGLLAEALNESHQKSLSTEQEVHSTLVELLELSDEDMVAYILKLKKEQHKTELLLQIAAKLHDPKMTLAHYL